jgi:hypothetical protein
MRESRSRLPMACTPQHVCSSIPSKPIGSCVIQPSGLNDHRRRGLQSGGGRFMPHLSGWMTHVYPFETDPEGLAG